MEANPAWSLSSVKKLVMRLKKDKPVGSWKGRVTGPLVEQAERIDEIVKENPTITLAELQAEVGGSRSGLSPMLRSRLEYKTYKQVRSMDLKAQHKLRRKAWCQRMLLRLNSTGRLRQKLKPLKLSHIIWSDETCLPRLWEAMPCTFLGATCLQD